MFRGSSVICIFFLGCSDKLTSHFFFLGCREGLLDGNELSFADEEKEEEEEEEEEEKKGEH